MTIDYGDALLGLVAKGAVKVPPYPAVAMRLTQIISGGQYGLPELSKLIAQDPMLAADVLRCANSSVYARGAEVTSLGQAVSRIGAREVAQLALASGLSSAANGAGPLQNLKREIWQRSVAAALVCQVLAAKRGLPVDEAFA